LKTYILKDFSPDEKKPQTKAWGFSVT